MIARDAWPRILLICGVAILLFSCSPKPDRPLPWGSNDRHTIDVVNRDYEVSRFWACEWGSTCPMKTWTYDLRVTPEDPIQALLWLQRSRTKYDTDARPVIEAAMFESSTPEQVRKALVRALELETNRLKDLEVSKESLAFLEASIARLDRIVSGDRTAIEEIMKETSEGLLFHATYRVNRAGKANERVIDWWLLPGTAP